ncbi:MAG: HepT-like ribonuclease domain-containing protein [Bacteroidales bacterium]
MDKPTPKERLVHIRSAILHIKSFVKDKSLDDFMSDTIRQNAVLYKFIIIGEAIRHVDNSILDKYPYPWYIPRSFRNFIAYEYHKINLESVYNAENDLDELLKTIDMIISKEFKN